MTHRPKLGAAMSEPDRRWAMLGVAGLASIVFAQPLFEVLGSSPEYFVVRRSSALEVILFALGLLLPGFMIGVAVALIGGASLKRRRAAAAIGVAMLIGFFVVQVGLRLDLARTPTVVAAMGVAVLAGVSFQRYSNFRWFVAVLSLAPPLFLVVFLARAPIAELLAPAPMIAPGQPDHAIVFVILDEFPTASLLDADGQIDSSRFPNFARLAATSTWYRNAATVHSHTAYAVPAILSGTFPGNRVPHYAAYPQSLFTVAGTQGAVIDEPFTHLCPPPLCPETDDGEDAAVGLLDFAVRLWQRLTFGVSAADEASLADPFGELAAAGVTVHPDEMLDRVNAATQSGPANQFRAFIEKLRPNTLNFLHVLLPHAPYRYYPDGTQYNDFETLSGVVDGRWSDLAFALTGQQRHLLQVAHVDGLLGELIDKLNADSMFDDSLLVLVADHGVAFEPGVLTRNTSLEGSDEVGYVPMLIKYPGQHEKIVDARPVSTIDLLPTVADVLKRPMPLPVDGHSLVDSDYSGTSQTIYDLRAPPLSLRDLGVSLSGVVMRNSERFPLEGISGLFGVAPFSDWRGRNLQDLAILVPGVGPSASILNDDLLLRVMRESGVVPGFVRGVVDANRPPPGFVVIAEKGVVLALSDLLRTNDGSSTFEAVVDPSLLEDGPHSLQLFLLDPVEGSAQLLDYDSPSIFSLDEERGRLVTNDGRSYQVVPASDSRRGVVESVGWEPAHLVTESAYLIGWAIDDQARVGADEIVVIADGLHVATAIPTLDLRGQLSEISTSTVQMNGFAARIPFAPRGSILDVRVLAIFGTVAFELELREQVVTDFASGGAMQLP